MKKETPQKKNKPMVKYLHIYGLTSIAGAIYFLMSVVLLGLIQPGYNHFIDTISVLALGKYGWIQQINFIVLALSFASLGIGIGLIFYRRLWNRLTIGFLLLSLSVIFVLLFKADPVDRTEIKLIKLHSQEGFIHISTTFLMILLIPFFLMDLIKKLSQSKSTYGLAVYTVFVTIFNLVFGFLWFYCRNNGIGFEIKGIWQKTLVLNVLVWMIVMGKWLYRQKPDIMKL